MLDGRGVWAGVTSEAATGLNDGSESRAYADAGSGPFLVAPLLRVVGERGRRRLVVGQMRVAVPGDGIPKITLALQATWAEQDRWHQETDDRPADDGALIASLAEPSHPVRGDAAATAVTIGKALAESSRNAVRTLRELRYELERDMADLLANRKNAQLKPLLGDVIELSIAVGQASDQVREAIREGLWIWLWDNAAYERVLADRGQAAAPPPDRVEPWERTYRAAIRQCEAMDGQLEEEAEKLHSLLAGMSTFAVAQEGEAQERFNLIIAVAAAGLGLPALILSLYGADSFLPFTFDRSWRALLPIASTSLVAAAIVMRFVPGVGARRAYIWAIGIVAALVVVLLFAGVLAPGS